MNFKFNFYKLPLALFLIFFMIISLSSVYASDYDDVSLVNHDSIFLGSVDNCSVVDFSSNISESKSSSLKPLLKESGENKSISTSLNKSDVILTANDLAASYKSKNFTAKLTDSQNNPISGVKISFKISSKTYNRTTDGTGMAHIMINLSPGQYNVTTSFEGDKNYQSAITKNTIKISKKKLTIETSNLSKKHGNSNRFQLKITDNGKPVSNIKLALKLGKTYFKITNDDGIASLAINLKIGKYVINSSICTNKNYYSDLKSNNITVSTQNPYKLSVLKWGSKGNIKKNTVLWKNIPKSSLTNAIVATCNSGTPLIQFGDGSGKKVFIVSGIHGSELSSQAAAFKLINSIYNSKSKLNGTVYIIPVISPKSTAANTRYYNGVNLNSVANKKGTLSNNLVNYAKSLKVNVVGDFHCTMPGGNPGKNVAMGTYAPTASSASLAKYIAKTKGYSSLIYKKAGLEYPGAVEDVINLAGITSVTCEALTPHGTIAKGSVNKSLNMMNALLSYYGMKTT